MDQSTAVSRSASANTTFAPLPPSSRLTGTRLPPAIRAMARPVLDAPVNVIRSIPALSVSACPADSGPYPWTTLNTPGGRPASIASRASIVAVAGLSSAGLRTTVLPQARAGATFQGPSISGKFHGAMAATTPAGPGPGAAGG